MIRRDLAELKNVKKNKRDCFYTAYDFVNSDSCYDGKVLVLYGLRHTGKTTIIEQVINAIDDYSSCAYYQLEYGDSMEAVISAIIEAKRVGVRYIFIDEITLAEDFITNAAVLSDIFAKEGIRIVVSGDDSLGFLFAGNSELYDRTVWVNTTYVPFAEHSRVLEVNDVDDYVRYGGLMKKDADGKRIVFDYESVCRYLDSSVVSNIVSSIKKSPYDSPLDIFSKEELKTIIEKLVELYSGVISVKQLVNQLSNVIEHSVTESLLKYLESVLKDMNFLSATSVLKFSRTDNVWYCDEDWKYYVIQPAIKYYHLEKAKEFIDDSDYYRQLTMSEKNCIKQELEEKILGDVLEQIVIFDCTKSLGSDRYTVTKPVFYEDGIRKGEYDMLIWDKHSNIHWKFEIKHGEVCDYTHVKYLRSSAWDEVVNRNFGECAGKCVLYRGKSCGNRDTDIMYVNVTEFLVKLGMEHDVQTVLDSIVRIILEKHG